MTPEHTKLLHAGMVVFHTSALVHGMSLSKENPMRWFCILFNYGCIAGYAFYLALNQY